MEVIVILILASLGVAVLFLGVFIWATRSGQFDDTTTPAMRMLTDDPPAPCREPANGESRMANGATRSLDLSPGAGADAFSPEPPCKNQTP